MDGVVERDGHLWVPILPKRFFDALSAQGLDIKRRDDWPKDLSDEYDRLRSQFTKAKAEFLAWVRKDRDSRMTPTAKTVTTTLIECLNFDNGRCDPSHQFLADEIGISRRQVERLVPKIEAAGWIEVTRRGCKETNSYRFRVANEKIAAILDYTDHLREQRREEREKRKSAAHSDPTPMSDQTQSDPTFTRSPDPTPMSVLDPSPMSDKPLNRTSEGEPLKPSKGSEGEGYTLRVRADETENAYARVKGA
jgi:hypothetical protein